MKFNRAVFDRVMDAVMAKSDTVDLTNLQDVDINNIAYEADVWTTVYRLDAELALKGTSKFNKREVIKLIYNLFTKYGRRITYLLVQESPDDTLSYNVEDEALVWLLRKNNITYDESISTNDRIQLCIPIITTKLTFKSELIKTYTISDDGAESLNRKIQVRKLTGTIISNN